MFVFVFVFVTMIVTMPVTISVTIPVKTIVNVTGTVNVHVTLNVIVTMKLDFQLKSIVALCLSFLYPWCLGDFHCVYNEVPVQNHFSVWEGFDLFELSSLECVSKPSRVRDPCRVFDYYFLRGASYHDASINNSASAKKIDFSDFIRTILSLGNRFVKKCDKFACLRDGQVVNVYVVHMFCFVCFVTKENFSFDLQSFYWSLFFIQKD